MSGINSRGIGLLVVIGSAALSSFASSGCSSTRPAEAAQSNATRIPEKLIASAFELQREDGSVCARLALEDGEPVLQFLEQPGDHSQLEIGLGSFGAPQITLHATKPYEGATISIYNEGCPAEMCIELKSAPSAQGGPSVLRMILRRGGEPSLEFVAPDGKRSAATLVDIR